MNELLAKNIESLTLIRKLKKRLTTLDDDRRYKGSKHQSPAPDNHTILTYIELTELISMVTRLETLMSPKAQLPKYTGRE